MNIDELKRLKYIKGLCEESLLFYTRYFFKHSTGQKFIVNSHHKEIARHLQMVERGEIQNLIINIPPRYSKTEMAVINWISRCIAVNPAAKFIHLSYSDDLALDNSTRVRELVKSEQYQQLWPVGIKKDSDSKKKWYTERGGGLYATAAGGAITGFGAGTTSDNGLFGGAIVIDDPHKVDDVLSDSLRNQVNERLLTTIQSRRNSRKTPIIIIMQRLHEDDMTGYVLAGKMGLDFHHLCLPALNEETGEALWPSKHTADELRSLRSANAYIFAGQYQQTPVPHGGGMIKMVWFNRYAVTPAKFERITQSWDTANKAGELNDYSVCTTWGTYGGNEYLLDVYRERLEYPDLKRMVGSQSEKWKPHAILLEDKASGTQLLQDLRRNSSLPLIAIEPEGDKITRAAACSAMIEAGRTFIPSGEVAWMADFEVELMNFPNSKHKDQVDSVSQYLNWVRAKGGTSYAQMMAELGY